MLEVSLASLKLKNPVLSASGTFGHSLEMSPYVDFSKMGAIVLKTVTRKPRGGNPPPRLFETASGLMNSIGLENHGIDYFIKEELPKLANCGTPVIANIGAESEEDFRFLAERLDAEKVVSAMEVNLSCPNVQGGKLLFSSSPQAAESVIRLVRKTTKKTLIAKLSPNVTRISEIAKAVEAAGSDAVTAVNTVLALAIDWRKRSPKLGAGFGGLSGPAIKPIALRMVYECSQSIKIPVIGCGGVASTDDVLEFLVAGASAVQVGTWNYVEPGGIERIVEELPAKLQSAGISKITDLIATLKFPSANQNQE